MCRMGHRKLLPKNKHGTVRIYETHSAKHHKCVRPVYLQTDKILCSIPLILLKPSLQGSVDPAGYKMEELRKTFPIRRISLFRRHVSRIQTMGVWSIERCRT